MRRVAIFGAVGLANTAVDFVAFILLTQAAGISPLLANVASFSLGAINSYILNRLVTFADAAAPLSSPGAMLRFAAVTAVGLVVSSLALAAGLALSLGEIPAKAASIAVTFATGFVLSRAFVFAPVRSGEGRRWD